MEIVYVPARERRPGADIAAELIRSILERERTEENRT